MTALDRTQPAWRHITVTGGILNGCTVRVNRRDADRGVIRLPGHRGRYVAVDGEWCWETDHAS